MAQQNSDARKTLKELVDDIKSVFKKHSRTARERAWNALTSSRAQEKIHQAIKNPSITISNTNSTNNAIRNQAALIVRWVIRAAVPRMRGRSIHHLANRNPAFLAVAHPVAAIPAVHLLVASLGDDQHYLNNTL